jgi:maltooligosyltrehalose trehalohydrolase
MSSAVQTARRLPIGAEPSRSGGTHFRVWAPRRRRVAVVLADPEDTDRGWTHECALAAEDGGYFSGFVADAGPGSLYSFRLDDDPRGVPDPASRFQPSGPHGPSQVVDPAAFQWTDGGGRGARLRGQVLYELHAGTFTSDGTWASAARELPALADVGVTLIELLPVAEFAGRFGWGYDGVDLFAPSHLYGAPDDLRRFVDAAHAIGLGVVLDVVYNHLGPDGNYLREFAPGYFTDRYETDWGEAIAFDGPDAGPVREFFVSNAAYWVAEFHLDGLRLDATQDIHDGSAGHILAEIARAARAAAGRRPIVLIAENEPQQARLVRPLEQGGYGLDAVWNDDFHHAAVVAMTGRAEAYYTDYRGAPQEFVSLAKRGYLYQGQRYGWQKGRRGTPTAGVPAEAFVTFLENHDQVANSRDGRRLHQLGSPGRLRALTALLLLGPGTPMLFQGQEFASSAPFLYFADHTPELAVRVAEGRKAFLAQFPRLATPAVQERLPPPHAVETFARSKLDPSERRSHAEWLALHRDLLRLRREDPVFAAQARAAIDGAVLSTQALVLRWDDEAGTRLLLVNLGPDLRLDPVPEPLLAPPDGREWSPIWSSEHPAYGGAGVPPLDPDAGWRLPAESATVMAAS